MHPKVLCGCNCLSMLPFYHLVQITSASKRGFHIQNNNNRGYHFWQVYTTIYHHSFDTISPSKAVTYVWQRQNFILKDKIILLFKGVPLKPGNTYLNIWIVRLSPCHTRVASSRWLHGVQEKLRTPRCAQWDLLEHRGIAVASPLDAVGSPRTPCHGAHFVHARSARRCSAFPRRSEWAPSERSEFAAATQ